jgi:preprotein translocase subunit SecG
MEAVIIVIHLMVIVALVAVVLLQRSEGGALGIGSSNAFLTSRGQGNVLTRATTILGIAFFLTSVALTVLTRLQPPPSAILNNVPANIAAPATTTPVPSGQLPGIGSGTLNLNPAPIAPLPGPSIAPAAPAPLATAPAATAPTAIAPTTPAPATTPAPGATAPATTPAPAAPTSPAQ